MDLNIPKHFTPRTNQTAKDWQIWKEEFLVYLKLTNEQQNFSEEKRALLLLNLMGSQAFEAMEQMSFENSCDKNNMDILLTKFDEFFNPPLNEIEERYDFFSRIKRPNEDIDEYVADLKEQANKCNFGNQLEKFIIDMLIINMDDYLRKMILASDLETLLEIIQFYKLHTIKYEKMEKLSENLEEKKSFDYEQFQHYEKLNSSSEKHIPANRICSKCGTNHLWKQCPAFDEICQKCYSKGHYTSKCKEMKSFNKNAKFAEQNKIGTTTLKEQSKSSTSNVKTNRENFVIVNPLQNCLWCNTRHMQGQCPHSANCKHCNFYPHNVCFECKKNPHENNCYYKNIVTLPSIKSIETPATYPVKLCTKCGKNHAGDIPCEKCFQQPTLRDAHLKTKNAFRRQAQPQKQQPVYTRQRQEGNHRGTNSKNYRKKNENSDSCFTGFSKLND